MRYIRFLKTPRIICDKNTLKPQLHCLVTITSDLGDSFLPYNLTLSAELLDAESNEVKLWQTVQWTSARSLPIIFPLSRARNTRPLRVYIGVEPKATYDKFGRLLNDEFRATVSAWSAQIDPLASATEAERLVERRFDVGNGVRIGIWEETGESIARHLW
jgi:hypothetical protein